MRIVVTEYPKSGGTWVVGMLGDALRLPKRDIYISDQHPWLQGGSKGIDLRGHPWFADSASLNLTDSCVIKSHELPNSSLIEFPARFIHLIRDGRDVVVSKYFYERDFCVANGIYEKFDVPFEDYVAQVALEWRNYVLAWKQCGIATFKYEDFLEDTQNTLQTVLDGLGLKVEDAELQQAIDTNTKVKLKQALDKAHKYNTFIRKGISGDWRHCFKAEHVRAFKQLAGDALIQLGYEHSSCW
jgi:hypothetical protein